MLVIDAGNSRIKLGRIDPFPADARALPACRGWAAYECGRSIDAAAIESVGPGSEAACISGSNPRDIDRILREWPAEFPSPRVLLDRGRFPITIDVDSPDKVGIDRLLNAIAANVVRQADQPAILISSGTATTVDFVNPAGEFCGGAILPGFDLCARALHEYTALLPLIEMSSIIDEADAPPQLGRNTEAAITSGLYWGHVGAVKELMRRLMLAGEPHREPLILLTGGAAPLLFPHLPTIVRHEPHLSLQGLAIAAAATYSP